MLGGYSCLLVIQKAVRAGGAESACLLPGVHIRGHAALCDCRDFTEPTVAFHVFPAIHPSSPAARDARYDSEAPLAILIRRQPRP